jgi:hypothetical protein
MGADGATIRRARTRLLNAYPADVVYIFESDKLFSVTWTIYASAPEEDSSGANLFSSIDSAQEACAAVKRNLRREHGEPSIDWVTSVASHASWRNNSARIDLWSRNTVAGTHVRLEFRRPAQLEKEDRDRVRRQSGAIASYWPRATLLQRGMYGKIGRELWRGDAAMDLKWLMGPGDVKELYGDLCRRDEMHSDMWEGGECLPAETYYATKRIQVFGDTPLVFQFYRGQLIRVGVHPPSLPNAQQIGRASVAGDGYSNVSECHRLLGWGSDVRTIISEKYGKPIVAPSEELAPSSPGVVKDDLRISEKYGLVWEWRANFMMIRFVYVGWRNQRLDYLYDGQEGRECSAKEIDFKNYESAQAEARNNARKRPF